MTKTDWQVGDHVSGRTRQATLDRIIWYEDGLTSAVLGRGGPPRKNSHTDLEHAKKQGLSGLLADGMLATNWISEILVAEFGMPYLENGALRTKYIKPTYVGMWVTPHFKVTAIEDSDAGKVITMEVWTDNTEGTLLTVGEARITI